MTRIKICGLTDEETALSASRAGADFLGFVFAPSRRRLTPERASVIIRVMHQLEKRPLLVGIFADTPPDEVNTIARNCQLDLVQLCSREDNTFISRIELPVIKVIHIGPKTTSDEVQQEIMAMAGASIYLLDSALLGGSGQLFNWEVAREVCRQRRVIIAGGLDSENVGQLIREIRPWGVDVSSGVETDGRKDPGKIKKFIGAVGAADKEVNLVTR